jgi:hypothetical protein
VLYARGEEAEANGYHQPDHRDESEVGRGPTAQTAEWTWSREAGHRPSPALADRNPKAFERIRDAGQAPVATNIHWFRPTNTVSNRNHGDTKAASAALRIAIVPAIAKRTLSNGHLPLNREEHSPPFSVALLSAVCSGSLFISDIPLHKC